MSSEHNKVLAVNMGDDKKVVIDVGNDSKTEEGKARNEERGLKKSEEKSKSTENQQKDLERKILGIPQRKLLQALMLIFISFVDTLIVMFVLLLMIKIMDLLFNLFAGEPGFTTILIPLVLLTNSPVISAVWNYKIKQVIVHLAISLSVWLLFLGYHLYGVLSLDTADSSDKLKLMGSVACLFLTFGLCFSIFVFKFRQLLIFDVKIDGGHL